MGAVASAPSVALPVRRPVPQPYVRLATMLEDGVFVYAPALARRLCLPASSLIPWNQKILDEVGINGQGTPWLINAINSHARFYASIAQFLINSGSSVILHALTSYMALGIYLLGAHTYSIWYHNKALNKFRFEFYLDNDCEENNPIVIIDDGGVAFWTLVAGSESDDSAEKVKGTDSYKVDLTAQTLDAYHDYGLDQDWLARVFLCLYVYGANTGDTVRVEAWNEVYASKTNGYYYALTDNFTGWKRVVLPILKFTDIGTPTGWDHVRCIRLLGGANQTCIYRFDRSLVDIGQWAKVEVYVPDLLDTNVFNVHLFAYKPSISNYDTSFLRWDGEDNSPATSGNGSVLWFLDETNGSIYLTAGNAMSAFPKGERAEVKNVVFGNAPPITYSSYYGCLKRIGFAIKMPPDDGQDSSTAGISQCKLKLEVYYDKVFSRYLNRDIVGPATYEFENGSNQYYGLTNWNERWLALFDQTTKTVEFLIFSERPTSLKVRADEDELIDMIEVGLPAGARVWLGELTHGDLTRDTDSDDVPDFIEDFIQNLIPKRSW